MAVRCHPEPESTQQVRSGTFHFSLFTKMDEQLGLRLALQQGQTPRAGPSRPESGGVDGGCSPGGRGRARRGRGAEGPGRGCRRAAAGRRRRGHGRMVLGRGGAGAPREALTQPVQPARGDRRPPTRPPAPPPERASPRAPFRGAKPCFPESTSRKVYLALRGNDFVTDTSPHSLQGGEGPQLPWPSETRVQALVPPLTSCVTWGKLLTLSEPVSSSAKRR